jgi:hypothetical protein
MTASFAIFFSIAVILAYVVAPASLIWGWVRWGRLPRTRTLTSIFSLIGLILATASGLLAISTAAYARIHSFEFFDPFLMRIFRWGFLLSLAGFVFAMGGVWRKNSLRWHALASAVGTLAFWMIAAAGE